MVDWLSDNNLSLTLHVPNLYIKKKKEICFKAMPWFIIDVLLIEKN